MTNMNPLKLVMFNMKINSTQGDKNIKNEKIIIPLALQSLHIKSSSGSPFLFAAAVKRQ